VLARGAVPADPRRPETRHRLLRLYERNPARCPSAAAAAARRRRRPPALAHARAARRSRRPPLAPRAAGGTVSFPIVDAHLTLEDGAIALPLSPQRAAEVRAMAILSMERAIGALELERDAAAAAARGGSGGGGGGARRSVYPLSSALARSHNLTPSAALVVNLGRLIKWLAVFSIFAVTVEVLMGTTVALFAPYQPALLIVLIAPILGYIGAARLEPRLVLVRARLTAVAAAHNQGASGLVERGCAGA
jgi:hypothetical protein